MLLCTCEAKYSRLAKADERKVIQQEHHCVKSVQIRSYFWSVFSCTQSEYRKIWTRNNSVFGHFSPSDKLSNQLNNSKNETTNMSGFDPKFSEVSENDRLVRASLTAGAPILQSVPHSRVSFSVKNPMKLNPSYTYYCLYILILHTY